jgi:hypothetical protein
MVQGWDPVGCDLSHSARSRKPLAVTIRSPTLNPFKHWIETVALRSKTNGAQEQIHSVYQSR